MKRIIDHFLLEWKSDGLRQPLLLRGARQVGKTYAVRQLGKTFEHFVEINFEATPSARSVFDAGLDPHRIIRDLSSISQKSIIPGKTLLFLDEVQITPIAITALRYFYELMPTLHVIAAGSLLDFAIEEVGVPVGRITFLYMYPLSFAEFLVAIGYSILLQEIMQHSPIAPFSSTLHSLALRCVGEYLAIGGMPYAIAQWLDKQDPLAFTAVHRRILGAYRQDFGTYARKLQVKYVDLIFKHIPLQMGRKFKYSLVEGEYRKRELAPALDLLETAGIAHKIHYSAGQGIPLGAQIDPQDYKTIFLDIALAQTALGLKTAEWFLNPEDDLVNKGTVVESFVGQELMAYSEPYDKAELFYWHRETGPANAEVDYLINLNRTVIPLEVKAGSGSTLRSMHSFLERHPTSPYGVRFSTHNYSVHEKIHSYPLYAIAQLVTTGCLEMRKAIEQMAKN